MKIAVAFGICLVLFGVAAGDRGLPALLRAREQVSALSREIAALRAENARLKVRADALRSDPSAIEAVARQRLGLLRRDEILVIRPR
jgi:cell division protein FtsB